jgi:hypothetical protein
VEQKTRNLDFIRVQSRQEGVIYIDSGWIRFWTKPVVNPGCAVKYIWAVMG